MMREVAAEEGPLLVVEEPPEERERTGVPLHVAEAWQEWNDHGGEG